MDASLIHKMIIMKALRKTYAQLDVFCKDLHLDSDYGGELRYQGDIVYMRSKVGRTYDLLCDKKIVLGVNLETYAALNEDDVERLAKLVYMQAFGYMLIAIGSLTNPTAYVAQIILDDGELSLIYGVM